MRLILCEAIAGLVVGIAIRTVINWLFPNRSAYLDEDDTP